MKYLSVKPIAVSIHRILEPHNTREHRTSTATSGLFQNYFDINRFVTTPEQIQDASNKRPDYAVEKLEDSKLVPHLFAEVKRVTSSANFDDILDQLEKAIVETVGDSCVNLTVFIVVMKGIKIGFLEYYSYKTLLDESGIPNYKGFVPLTYNMSEEEFLDINQSSQPVDHFIYENRTNVPTDPKYLRRLGVESSSKVKHPYI